MITKAIPDMTKSPFYALTSDDGYSGVPKSPSSTLLWYNMLAKIAGSTKDHKTHRHCVCFIRKHAKYLCENRNKPDLNILMNFRSASK
jgi:hypothetical protein